MKKITKSACWN